MKIAVEGCAHGELDKIYETIAELERREQCTVDVLLCCGDFQSTRNADDLECMAVPKKFQDMCSFYKYYSGEKVAPVLTIFIGGNHEASNYLQELPYGGWVAPRIYYLGYAGVVQVNGVRIGGVSGIYKGFDYFKGHYEMAPYDNNTKRSVYHVRQLDVYRLKQLSSRVDIMLSHDWPRGVYNFGDADQLCRFKPHFRDEIAANKLGSPPCEDLLNTIRPDYWFAAHLHCKFSAVVEHDTDPPSVTKFLALDKCLPKRRFLQLVDIPTEDSTRPPTLSYDLEWLAILNTTNHLIDVKSTTHYMPGPGSPYRFNFTPTHEEKAAVLAKLSNDLHVPLNFVRTAEPYDPHEPQSGYRSQPKAQLNPQTTSFCELLNIDDPVSLLMVMQRLPLNHSTYRDKSDAVELEDSPNGAGHTDDGSPDTTSIVDAAPRARTEFALPEPVNADQTAEDNPDQLSLYENDAPNRNVAEQSDFDPLMAIKSSSPNATLSTACEPQTTNDDDDHDSGGSTESNKSLSDVAALLTSAAIIVSPDSSLVDGDDAPPPPPAEDSGAPDAADSVAAGGSPPKKFKRRNQEIYAAKDDDEE